MRSYASHLELRVEALTLTLSHPMGEGTADPRRWNLVEFGEPELARQWGWR